MRCWGDKFTDRNTFPLTTDVVFGAIFILLIIEALRRTNGLILLSVTICFLLYALFGDSLPAPWTHKGYDLSRLVGFMYMTLEGVFGTAVDVSSTLIILLWDLTETSLALFSTCRTVKLFFIIISKRAFCFSIKTYEHPIPFLSFS